MKTDIGIGIKPPAGKCEDVKCAWHGKISVRGRIFEGIVKSARSRNTVVVEWDYHRYIPKYERYARGKTKVKAHNPPCIHAKEGDKVIIAECRPISKTKSFIVVSIEKEKAKLFFAKEMEKQPEKKMKNEKKEKEESIEKMFRG